MYPIIFDFGLINIFGFQFHLIIYSFGLMLVLAFYACYFFLDYDLKKLGYDTYMVFVNTTLEVAQQRNETRPRRLPADIVEKSWKEVQGNMAYFQGLFGNANFMIVDNNKHLTPEDAKKKFKMLVEKGIKKFINKPIRSKIAKKWIAQQKLVPKQDLKQMLKK